MPKCCMLFKLPFQNIKLSFSGSASVLDAPGFWRYGSEKDQVHTLMLLILVNAQVINTKCIMI